MYQRLNSGIPPPTHYEVVFPQHLDKQLETLQVQYLLPGTKFLSPVFKLLTVLLIQLLQLLSLMLN